MRKLLVIFAAAAMMTSLAAAQTATGNLTVTATVTGSINLVFNKDTGGAQLTTGAGTSNATIDFGTVSAFNNSPIAGVTIPAPAPTATSFTVNSVVDVQVIKTNSASANYDLSAQLTTADAAGNAWAANGTALSTTAQIVLSGATYGSNVPVPLSITIPFANPSGTVSNVLIFTATAK